jgi:hypothetical protein
MFSLKTGFEPGSFVPEVDADIRGHDFITNFDPIKLHP